MMRHGIVTVFLCALACVGCTGSPEKLPDAFRLDRAPKVANPTPAVNAEKITEANAHEQAQALLRELER